MCPWHPDENPNFKPQKKHFHTAQHPDMLKRSGLEFSLDDINLEKLAKLKEMQMNLNLEESATEQEMLCDLRKVFKLLFDLTIYKIYHFIASMRKT